MGKGRRNRERHIQDSLKSPVKAKKQFKLPSWFSSVVALVIVIAIMLPLIISGITDSGVFKRNRILIKSNSGKFDVNQQVATFIAWETLYETALQYYQYYKYGMLDEESSKMMASFKTADDYAINMAVSGIQSNLRDSVDEIVEQLKRYVAVCDIAYEEGITLTEEDEKSVEDVIVWLEELQTSYGYNNLKVFLKSLIGDGMKEKDVRKATEIVVLYNKYVEMKQLKLDSAIMEDPNNLINYRDQNPSNFYKADYLSYATEDKDFSEKLKAAKNEKEFRELVANYFLDKNYKTTFNKYTVTADVADLIAGMKTLTDGNEKTALSDKLNDLKFDATTEYTKGQEGLNQKLSDWLFDSKRTQYEKGQIATDDGIYVAVFYSEKANTEKVSARVKFYAFEDGTSFDGDNEFKTTLYKIFLENNNKTKDEDKSKHEYLYAHEKADKLVEALNKEGADTTKILQDNGFINATIDHNTETDTPTKDIYQLVTAENTKAGKAYDLMDEDDNSFVVYVIEITEETVEGKQKKIYKIAYLETEDDVFVNVLDDLQVSLDKEFKASNTAAYNKDAAEGSYQAWLSKTTEGFTSALKAGDTLVIDKTEKKTVDGTEKDVTTYTAYMALENEDHGNGNVLYLDKSILVNGGYLAFDSIDKANEAAELLKGKTGAELSKAMSAITSDKKNTTPSTSNAFSRTALDGVSKDLGAWFFDDARTANEISVISVKDSTGKVTGTYLVFHIEKAETWARSARNSLLSEQLTDWMEEISAPYTVNEKKLAKLGEASTTAATTATTAA